MTRRYGAVGVRSSGEGPRSPGTLLIDDHIARVVAVLLCEPIEAVLAQHEQHGRVGVGEGEVGTGEGEVGTGDCGAPAGARTRIGAYIDDVVAALVRTRRRDGTEVLVVIDDLDDCRAVVRVADAGPPRSPGHRKAAGGDVTAGIDREIARACGDEPLGGSLAPPPSP